MSYFVWFLNALFDAWLRFRHVQAESHPARRSPSKLVILIDHQNMLSRVRIAQSHDRLCNMAGSSRTIVSKVMSTTAPTCFASELILFSSGGSGGELNLELSATPSTFDSFPNQGR